VSEHDRRRDRVVAAFDFDGTLTAYDTLLPFLAQLRGARAVTAALVSAVPQARAGRTELKEAVLARLLRGLDADEVATAGASYAETQLARRIRPEMRRVVDDHRARGHALVMVSASLEAYLSHVARSLGFDAVLATRLEVDEDGRLTGRLLGGNVRGDEKARLLRAWLGDEPYVLHAYGDSAGDRAMLTMAHHAVRVRRGRPRQARVRHLEGRAG
jgi:phosphatidylglycerophosphatase C